MPCWPCMEDGRLWVAPGKLRFSILQGNCTSCKGLNDAKDYAHVRSALKILMFSDAENWDLSKLLAAILHLGNVEFMAAVFENMDSSDVMETPAFPIVMKLLEVAWLLCLSAFVFVRRTQRLRLTEPQPLILITLLRLLLLLPTSLPGSQNQGKAVRANHEQSSKMMSGFNSFFPFPWFLLLFSGFRSAGCLHSTHHQALPTHHLTQWP